MQSLAVADFKADFSNILVQVQNGKEFGVLYGRNKKTVAVLSPVQNKERRKIGLYDGIASFSEKNGGKITLEEFLGK